VNRASSDRHGSGNQLDPQPVDLLVLAGTVLTMDDDDRVLAGGGVAVRKGRIVAVGPRRQLLASYRADEVVELPHGALLPGLVDSYAHAGHGLIRGLVAADGSWPAGELYWHGARERWWYAEALLAATERLRFGVTTGLSIVGATPPRCDSTVFADRNAEAYVEVGVRAVLGVGPPDPLFSHLSEPWSGSFFEGGAWVRRNFDYQDALAASLEVIRRWHGAADGRVRVALAPSYLFGRHVQHRRFHHSPPGSADAAGIFARAEQMRALAQRHGVVLHTHMFRGSVAYALEHLGAEATLQLLGPEVVVAHGNGFTQGEVDILGEARINVATVAYTHENLWYGYAPIRELLLAGANVTITSDGAAPYTSLDLWRELPRAIWNTWSVTDDQRSLPPERALRMVTIDAARALGLGDEVGSLEVGKRADLVVVDLDRPHLLAAGSVPWLLCHYASGHDVDTVVVEGRVLLRAGAPVTIDTAEVMALAREEATLALERIERSRYLGQGRGGWRWPHDEKNPTGEATAQHRPTEEI
jgi:cytosine/adenosine deaminase-related metal-dependent hydrolase